MSLSQLVCECGKATVVSNAVSGQVLYSTAVLAAICRVSNRTNSLDLPSRQGQEKKYAYSSLVVVLKEVDIYI